MICMYRLAYFNYESSEVEAIRDEVIRLFKEHTKDEAPTWFPKEYVAR